MKKESKANLIFVSLLVCSMIPGIYLLVRKKLNGDTMSAEQPDPVPSAVAYNQPPPFSPILPRKEPLIVRDWVGRLTQEKVGIDVSLLRTPAGGPVVSDAYYTQALACIIGKSGESDVWLLIWRDAPKPEGDILTGSRQRGILTFVSAEPIEIPKDVRHALQGVGYIDPPPHAWLAHWHGSAGERVDRKLQILHPNGTPPVENLTLP